MTYNICLLPKEEQEQIEVDKAAAYSVFKERSGEIGSAEMDAVNIKPDFLDFFRQRIQFYRSK